MRSTMLVMALATLLSAPAAWAEENEAKVGEKDLKGAKVSLEDGLKASEARGKPISAK